MINLSQVFKMCIRKKLPILSRKNMPEPSDIVYEEYSFLPSNRRFRVAYALLNWLFCSIFCVSVNKMYKSELGVLIGLWALENRKDSLF